MVSTLSPKRLALLSHVRQHPADNVAALVHAGLLERDAQGIRAPYDSVHTEISLV